MKMIAPPAWLPEHYSKSRKLAFSSGTIRIKRPRPRNLEERFVSRLMPLFKLRTVGVGAMLPEL